MKENPVINVDNTELWECIKDCGVHPNGRAAELGGRRITIKKGEKVEFRYHYEIHFRTEDNHYFWVEEGVFYDHFKPIGKIDPAIRFGNEATLEEILRLELYQPIIQEKL